MLRHQEGRDMYVVASVWSFVHVHMYILNPTHIQLQLQLLTYAHWEHDHDTVLMYGKFEYYSLDIPVFWESQRCPRIISETCGLSGFPKKLTGEKCLYPFTQHGVIIRYPDVRNLEVFRESLPCRRARRITRTVDQLYIGDGHPTF